MLWGPLNLLEIAADMLTFARQCGSMWGADFDATNGIRSHFQSSFLYKNYRDWPTYSGPAWFSFNKYKNV